MAFARWCLPLLVAAFASAQITISLEPRQSGARVRVSGWTGAWPADLNPLFSLRVKTEGAPQLAGKLAIEDRCLIFEPRFPLTAGVRYVAEFRPPTGSTVVGEVHFPAPAAPQTYVDRIYPTAAKVPENLLKLYLHFSAPMSRGEAWQRLQLLDDSGRPVELPFLEIDEELWDSTGTRLTVLFDPGRIKRDLAPNKDAGPPLAPGRRYTLAVAKEWADASGNPLKQGFAKMFEVTESDRTAIDCHKWTISPPRGGSREPLTVVFGEPLDAALALRLIHTVGPGRRAVEGKARLDRDETAWVFTPLEPWVSGSYALEISSELEDLAGNRVGRLFDVDRFERIDSPDTREPIVRRPFTVSAR